MQSATFSANAAAGKHAEAESMTAAARQDKMETAHGGIEVVVTARQAGQCTVATKIWHIPVGCAPHADVDCAAA